jgi:RNA polymerase sigma-70 factor (ECF subfamily)
MALVDPVDPAPGADEALAARRRWQATRRALASLPESQRAVVVLAKFEELSYDEIAEILGTSNSAVASRLFRAMRQLEKALADEGGEGAHGRGPRGSTGSRVS